MVNTLQTPTAPYRVVVSDCPWHFSDKLPGDSRGAEKQYDVLTIDEICNFQDFHTQNIAEDAVLFLWRVSSQVQNAYKVMNAWGFKEHSEIVWDKLTVTGKEWFGMGRIVRGAHESCIIATRGKGASLVKSKSIRSRFGAQVGKHSEKPEEFYKIVETLFDGPYLELFGRKLRAGWTVLGNEVPVLDTTISTSLCTSQCISGHKQCVNCGDVAHAGCSLLCENCTEEKFVDAG